MIKKIRNSRSGFTLVEVSIGIMILTMAIVSTSNLLVSLMSTNEDVVEATQAYYSAMEGIEAVRNIRDTNWLHNTNWLGDKTGDPWGEVFVPGRKYVIELNNPENIGLGAARDIGASSLQKLSNYAPWRVSTANDGDKRIIEILPYNLCGEDLCDDYVLVKSTVRFGENGEVSLEEVLTNWKGGAL